MLYGIRPRGRFSSFRFMFASDENQPLSLAVPFAVGRSRVLLAIIKPFGTSIEPLSLEAGMKR